MPAKALTHAIDRLSPTLAAAITYPTYVGGGKRRAVHERERATHEEARRTRMHIGGRRIIVYEWGTGPRTVLLVHGWRGRASQFASIVRELRSAGFRVVSFDAPASGDSQGRRTHMGEFQRVISVLARREPTGRFPLVVAHSAGTLAALVAAADRGITGRIVAISPVVRFSYLGEAFARMAGLGNAARLRHEGWFAARLRREGVDAGPYDLLARDLPPHLHVDVVHDTDDPLSDVTESRRFAARHPGQVRLVETVGLGHSHILRADVTLDTVLAVAERGA
ncbi:alpha/beta hydrolase [Microbacterium amylolyticum]|uniref:AB hydrolase-1 domain-containing protein n=1 Tax=Microbacterium amylolyticum TaxID=936337 RepID=A0ABS4ZIE6_9MICO|nr:alpha/beta hydrolase [Microbacterium amylolyticum]MBP2437037.1 hypothetical protein [Microbacterium amylolyticum]